MNRTIARWLVAGAASLLAACAVPPEEVATEEAAIFGSDACKNVDIRITNNYDLNGDPREILVLSVEFYSASEGRWISEDLANQPISPGAWHWWYDEDLQYLENDTLSSVRVHFKYREHDGDWSDATSQWIDITNTVCNADDNFLLTVN